MRFVDMFCGMGTARMGFEMAGHECVYSIEFDKHKRNIYKIIFGNEPEGSDIKNVRGSDIPRSDCWIAGFPCQDISIAGKCVGFGGQRSSLFFEVMRLLSETAEEDRPEYLLFENVKNFYSVNSGRDFLEALYQMDEIGYDAEWDCLNSKYFGVTQNRERVFIVGHSRRKCTRKVFPINGGNKSIDDIQGQQNVCNTLKTRYRTGGGESYIVECEQSPQIKKIGNLYNGQNGSVYDPSGISPTLRSGQGVVGNGIGSSNSPKIKQIGNLYPRESRDNPTDGRVYDITGLSPCLNKMEGGNRQPMVEVRNTKIRRLTARECFRLQAVPDYITDQLIEAGVSDTQMYRAAGDAWTVTVGYEIAKKMGMEG